MTGSVSSPSDSIGDRILTLSATLGIPPQPADGFVNNFEWVFDNGNKRRDVQRHVQTEIQRRKRYEKSRQYRKQTASITSTGPLPWEPKRSPLDKNLPTPPTTPTLTASTPPPKRQRRPKRQTRSAGEASVTTLKSSSFSDSSPSLSGSQEESGCEAAAREDRTLASLCPRIPFLSGDDRDPFSARPPGESPEIDVLVHHIVAELGPYCYGCSPKFDFIRGRSFAMALHSPAAFFSMLFVAATNMDSIKSAPNGVNALGYKAKAIQLINQGLADPSLCVDQGTVFAVALFTRFEHMFGAFDSYGIHAAGLQHLIVKLGGLRALRKFPLLENSLYGIAIATSGSFSAVSPSLCGILDKELTKEQELEAVKVEFGAFLNSVQILFTRQISPYRVFSFAFHRGTPIERLMTTLILPRNAHEDSVGQQERYRLATLLHLHCLVIQNDHDKLFRYVKRLEWMLRQEAAWRNSLEVMHNVLIADDMSKGLNEPDCSWKVLRLMTAASCVSEPLLSQVRELLLTCLVETDYTGKRVVAARTRYESIKLGVLDDLGIADMTR